MRAAASSVELSAIGLSTGFLGTELAGADTVSIRGDELLTTNSASTMVTNPAGAGAVFGFVVDLRSADPAVSDIAPASVNPVACTGRVAAAPCIVCRRQP